MSVGEFLHHVTGREGAARRDREGTTYTALSNFLPVSFLRTIAGRVLLIAEVTICSSNEGNVLAKASEYRGLLIFSFFLGWTGSSPSCKMTRSLGGSAHRLKRSN